MGNLGSLPRNARLSFHLQTNTQNQLLFHSECQAVGHHLEQAHSYMVWRNIGKDLKYENIWLIHYNACKQHIDTFL